MKVDVTKNCTIKNMRSQIERTLTTKIIFYSKFNYINTLTFISG